MKKRKVFKKAIAILLVILVVLSSIKFLILKPKNVFADSTIGFNEGYGTTVSDNNSNVTGTITNAVWKQEELCKTGKCLYFDGTGDYVSFADNANLDFGASNSFTLEGWFRTPDITSGQRTIIAKHNATAGGYKVYMDSSGYLVFGIDDDSTWTPDDTASTTTTAFDDNRWHFFSAVKTETAITIYVDGKQYQTDSSLAATGTLVNANSFYVGIDGNGSSNGFSGFLDEIKVIKNSKTAAEVIADYTGGSKSTTGAGPVGWWKMDENTGQTVNDSSGNDSNGLLGSTSSVEAADPTWGTGKLDSALTFDGTDDVVTIADTDSLSFANNTMTVSAWIKRSGNPAVNEYIVLKGISTWEYRFSLSTSGMLLFIPYTSAGASIATVNGVTSVTDGAWHYVTATSDGINATTYVDGVFDASTSTFSGTMSNTASNLYIGDRSDTANTFFEGSIDDVRLYNYARTQSQIIQDMQGYPPAGAAASFTPDQSHLSDGLVGYWKMDEASDATRTDFSGSSNTLTESASDTIVQTTGKFGYSGDFESTETESLSITDATQNGLDITSNLTMCAWIKPETVALSNIVGKFSSPNLSYALHLQADGRVTFYASSDGTTYTQADSSTGAVTVSTWSHVCGVYDGSYLSLYVNGVQSGTPTSFSAGLYSGSADFFVGAAWGDYFDGIIDDVKIYNRSLKNNEVNQLYNFAPGPVGYWKFDENTGTTTAYDSSGYGSDATFGEGASETAITYNPWVAGKFGSAARFTGSDTGSVAVVGKPTILTELPQLSISAWVNNSQSALANNDRIVDHQSSNTAGWNFMMTTQERLRFVVDYDGATDLVVDTPVITNLQNVWHHVAVTWDGTANSSGVHLYMDGVEATPYANVTSGVGNRVAEGVNSSIGIGRRVNTNQASFTGIIDDVKIYNYPRTTTQILEDMNGGHPAPGSPIGSSVAKWKMDEGYSTTAHDSSMNGNDLTLSTASWTNGGKFGKAFNGLTNVRLSRTDDADLDLAAADDATFSVWFKSDSATNPTANEYLLEKGGNIAASAIGYAIYTASSGGTICFGIDDDATSFPEDSVCSSSDLYDNTWHHIVAKKTGTSRLDLYVDGKANGTPDTSISATGTLENASTFYIGDTNGTDGTDEFLGDIDEVQIFRSSLAEDQIKSLYNQGASASMGALSTDSSNNASNSDTDSFCPPGQGSSCTAPVAQWKLDENTGTAANDSSGNGLTGTLTNSPTWVTGKIGQAVKFDDALNQYISVGSSSSLGFASSFTISAWANTSLASTTQLIISKDGAGTAGDSRGYYLRFNSSGKINSALYNNSGTACDASPTVVSNTSVTTWAINTWYHITMVYDGSNIKLYINGILEDTDATAGTSCVATADNFEIGSFNGGANNLTGLVDNVMAYNYARTPAQIVWDYNHGAPVGWWKLDENTGTTANDSTGNSTAGTLTNAPTWATGKLNTGVTFAGSNQQILIADDSDFDFADDESMSVTGWFKHTTASAQEIILSKYAAAGYKVISESDGDITCGLDYDSTWSPTDSATSTLATYDDNSWHHFACVKDGATSLSLYIDGALITTDSSITATNTLTNADPLYLGIDADGTSNDYTGTLDDIRIYRYPLTAQQIKAIMNNGAAVKY